MSNNNGGGTWPEQDAIDLWIKKHNIAIVHQHTLELKNEVTKPRIEVQTQFEKAQQEIEQLKTSRRDYEVMYKLQQAGEKEIKQKEKLLEDKDEYFCETQSLWVEQLGQSKQEIEQLKAVVGAAHTLTHGWACPDGQGDQFDFDWINLDKALNNLKQHNKEQDGK
jgi:hypothetical protein